MEVIFCINGSGFRLCPGNEGITQLLSFIHQMNRIRAFCMVFQILVDCVCHLCVVVLCVISLVKLCC
jgi:hypothetical protein